ncbi:calcium/sodium antiporter [Leptolyngbya cf. ectocarpi LEGE 11479]|uniref:Calcium/sodium antiporter n=1 Tax=Leptolyngbya cf. ectocarpi LEGE 11479 TaxID=1828722 RepID=A0A928ZS04_LEPEC|nr:calcium/sodium antiporter [Leptolyngbya ectocarpi]MBE9065367.1 calcium/sodium antiporter [Leptolyngbya cf. ectocarpi LEGE 11479]
MTATVFLLLGIVFLVVGADFLVRGASNLAAMARISPLVIGLTVVAFGTSAPELAVSLHAAFNNQADLAVGNVVGSNICNVLLILGVSALVAPLVVAQQLVRLDVPIMIGVSGLVFLFSLDGRIDTSDGVILFLGGLSYTFFLLFQSRRETNPEVQSEYAQEYGPKEFSWSRVSVEVLAFLGGMACLVIGSQLLVEGAVTIANALQINPLIIGLTVVALGTSLPELATSIVASLRGERDIAVGNVVGSNIFNILVVLGMTSALSPSGIAIDPSVLAFDIPVMIGVAIMCLPICLNDNLVSRWEGLMLLVYYAAYTLYLIMKTTDHDSTVMYGAALKYVIVPLTILGLTMIMLRSRQSKRT